MLIRILTLLLVACSVATAQEPSCSSLALTVVKTPHAATAPAWQLFVENNSRRPVAVRIPSQDFHWNIQQADKGAWNEVLTGGIGLGVPSTGAKALPDLDTCTIRSRQRLLVDDFDLRRDIPEEGLRPWTKYKITFAQQVNLVNSAGSAKGCKLVAKPQVFRLEATTK